MIVFVIAGGSGTRLWRLATHDYPVNAMGIGTIAVDSWEQTALAVETIIKISNLS